MISENRHIALVTVGNAALQNPDWTDYANYCFDREKGLRKEAFKHLDAFLKSAKHWSIEKKKEFLNFFFSLCETMADSQTGLLPQPLSDQLIKGTLEEWCESEISNENPFRWYGKYYRSEEHLLQALAMNPSDDSSRQAIISRWICYIQDAVHHLPEFYIGEPFEDIKLGEKIKEQIGHLTTPELREYRTKELEEDLELVKNYADWTTSGHPHFEKWGQENNKRTGYGRTYYYQRNITDITQ